jgi:hypothetical protein
MPRIQSRSELESRLSAVSFGVFLVIIAVTWIYHPRILSEIIAYFRSFERIGHPVPPPPILIKPVVFFVYLLGAWLLVLAGIRAVAHTRGVTNDVSAGAFFIFCGYLLGLYMQGAITIGTLLPSIIILVGAIIVINGIVGILQRR